MRFALPLLLVVAAVASAEEDDPRTLAFQRYRAESLRHILDSSESRSEELVVALRGLDRHDCPAAAEFLLMEMLAGRPEGDVQREAVRVLAQFKSPETVAAMADLWESKLRKSIRAQTLALFAFGPKRTDVSKRVLDAALQDKDARVVIAACRAIGQGDDDRFKGEIVELLRHKEAGIRAWAAYSLAELAEFDTKPLLFQMFCKDKSNFARYLAWRALRKMEKDNRLPCDPAAWSGWWEEKSKADGAVWGASFPGARQTVAAGNWFGIPVLADRLVFVIDATQRMDQGWKIDPLKEREKPPEERTPNFFSVKTRFQLVLAHQEEVLEQLPDKTQVALTLYHDRAEPPNHSVFPDGGRWLKLSKRARAQVEEHLAKVVPGGTLSMHEALAAAWNFQAEKKPVERGAQMICFLTNGRPTGGEFKDRPDRIAGEVWAVGRERGIVFQAVGIHNHSFELMRDVAKHGCGLYVHMQQEGDPAEPQDLEFWPDKKAAFEAGRKDRKKQ